MSAATEMAVFIVFVLLMFHDECDGLAAAVSSVRIGTINQYSARS